jgi:hypothetical protein
MIFAALLAACDQGPSVLPTQEQLGTPEPTQGEAPTVEARPTDPVAAVIGQLPPPGTAIIPVTEEASVDVSQIPFTQIVYEEAGGIAATELYLEINADGRVVRDGVESHISDAEVANLTQALLDAHFFGIEGIFTAVTAGSDVYSYHLTVTLENGSEKRIDAQDGYTPPELQQLFSTLRQVGAPS